MNFYKRFIGDITAKTGGLSMSRMGAYDRLLDHYFSTEQAITPEEVYSICRAMNKQDRADVDHILARFWTLGEGGYTQSKADEVIAKALPLIEAARANGKKGGRPKKQNPAETQRVPEKNPAETQLEPSSKATQSQSQIPSSLEEGKRASALSRPEDVAEQVWKDWLALRKGKRATVSATTLDGARGEAVKAGMPLESFLRVWCLLGWQGLTADRIPAEHRRMADDWRTEQRHRTQQAAPGVAAGAPAAQFFIDVDSRPVPQLGVHQ